MSLLQFFIISVITIMVQSSPVKIDTDEQLLQKAVMRTDVQNKTVTLFCAAQSVQNTAAELLNLATLLQNINQSTLHESDINNNTKAVINETFNYFSSECQNFTLAMSLKHQLQDYLFNQSNQDLNYEDTEELSHQIKQLSSLLVPLQTMANIFDQLQFYKYTTNCPRLSSSEYKMMYQVQYSTTSLLHSISKLGGNWSHRLYYESRTKPDPRNCKLLNLFTAHLD